MEIKVSVYQFGGKNDDKDWIIARSKKQAIEFYKRDIHDTWEGPVRKLSEKELQKFTVLDLIDDLPGGEARTFAESAQRLETEIPSMIATQSL